MEKKQIDQSQLDKAFEQFANETPLNLTNEDKKEDEEDDPQVAAKLQAQYEKFMNEMKNNSLEGDENFDGFADALGGLLKGLGESLGLQGKQGEDFKNLFSDKGGEAGNMEDIAGKLLQVFMKKQLLYEPLQESKNNYEEFFKKYDLLRFKNQYEIIREILKVLDQNPEDKKRLMDLFEKMQDYGQPPAGIASVSLPGGM